MTPPGGPDGINALRPVDMSGVGATRGCVTPSGYRLSLYS